MLIISDRWGISNLYRQCPCHLLTGSCIQGIRGGPGPVVPIPVTFYSGKDAQEAQNTSSLSVFCVSLTASIMSEQGRGSKNVETLRYQLSTAGSLPLSCDISLGRSPSYFPSLSSTWQLACGRPPAPSFAVNVANRNLLIL